MEALRRVVRWLATDDHSYASINEETMMPNERQPVSVHIGPDGDMAVACDDGTVWVENQVTENGARRWRWEQCVCGPIPGTRAAREREEEGT